MSRRRLNPPAARWAIVRRQVFARDGWRCVLCGKAGRLECDHRVPLHRGGAMFELDNLRALCRDCHIAVTAEQNRRPLTAAQRRWRELVDAL